MDRPSPRPRSCSPNKNGSKQKNLRNAPPKIAKFKRILPDLNTPPRVEQRSLSDLSHSNGRSGQNPNAEQQAPGPEPKNKVAIRLNFDEPASGDDEEEEEVLVDNNDEELEINQQFNYENQVKQALDFVSRFNLKNEDLLKQDDDHYRRQCKYANRAASKKYSRSNFKRLPESLCGLLFESFPLEMLLRLYGMRSLGSQFKRNLFTRISIVSWNDSLLSSMGATKTTTFFRKINRSLRKLLCFSSTVPTLVLAMIFARQLETIYIDNRDVLSSLMFFGCLDRFSQIRSVTINDCAEVNDLLNLDFRLRCYLPDLKHLNKFYANMVEIDMFAQCHPPLPQLRSLSLTISTDDNLLDLEDICVDRDQYRNQIETLVLTLNLGDSLEHPWCIFAVLNELEHLTKLKLIIECDQSMSREHLERVDLFFRKYCKLPQTIETFSLKLRLQNRNKKIINENFFVLLFLSKLPRLNRLFLDISVVDGKCGGGNLDLEACASARIKFLSYKMYENVPIKQQIDCCSFTEYVRYLELTSLHDYSQLMLCLMFPKLEVLSFSFGPSPNLPECIDTYLEAILTQLPTLCSIRMSGYPYKDLNDPFRLTLNKLISRAKNSPENFYCLRIPFGQFITEAKYDRLEVKQTLLQLEPLPRNLKVY